MRECVAVTVVVIKDMQIDNHAHHTNPAASSPGKWEGSPAVLHSDFDWHQTKIDIHAHHLMLQPSVLKI